MRNFPLNFFIERICESLRFCMLPGNKFSTVIKWSWYVVHLLESCCCKVCNAHGQKSDSRRWDDSTPKSIDQVLRHLVDAFDFWRRAACGFMTWMSMEFARFSIRLNSLSHCYWLLPLPKHIFGGIIRWRYSLRCNNWRRHEVRRYKQAVIRHLKANNHELIKIELSAMGLSDNPPSWLIKEVKRRFSDIA